MDSDSFDELCCNRPKNDVFLNYVIEDIGRSFMSHLKQGLKLSGFTICDRTMLPISENETSEHLRAIEASEIYVVVFSKNYPFSIKCLDELMLIMDCFHKFEKRKVFPIFFDVDPSHVRSQEEGLFFEAFKGHWTKADPERVQKWRQSLNVVGQFCGLILQNGVDEAEFVLKIIKELEKIQSPQELHVPDYHVGIRPRAQKLISKLRLDSKDCVLVIAVFGISGIGKTTIVKAVYNKISPEFDVSCFLADIHYHCGGPNWKVNLPKLLMSCLTQNDKFSIMGNHNDDVTKIRSFIRGRKILLVLDDVDNFQQLEALGIDPKLLNNGSRIIVTTRDKQSLGYLPYISYHTTLLNERESLNLFTRLVFARDDPVNNNFIQEVVSHAEGLPLVLQVWSRHFKQYEKEQWPNILETLKRIPHGDVQKQLQMSYDSLSDRSKKLFLDIACCFFNGMCKDLVVKVLEDEDSGFFPDIEIQYIVDKSLVKIDEYFKLSMHHAIREMGQEVVRQENEDELGQRTRLMDHRDVVRVLKDCWGTKSIEGIRLGEYEIDETVTLHVEGLKKMSNLRFIQLHDSEQLSWSSSSSSSKDGMSSFHLPVFKLCRSSSSNDDVSYFSFKKLKYLEWYGFPFKCINIDMTNVVVIKLHDSKLEKLWEGFKSLTKLRILDLSYSRFLTKTGNFTGLEKLEELILYKCEMLKELHSSIGCLGKLVLLDLSHCTQLKRFSHEMKGNLRSLRKLDLRYCPYIGAKRVKVLEQFLCSLNEYCITTLNLLECNISKLSLEFGSLRSLNTLFLSGNRFPSLPDNLCQLHELEWIYLDNCPELKSIPDLHPDNITFITARNCISLVSLPSNMPEFLFLITLYLDGCLKLGSEGFMKVTGLSNLQELRMKNCNVSKVSIEIGNLVSLRKLDLSENTFSSLPDSFSNLSKLGHFKINDCFELELLPLLPLNLTEIEARGCRSLNVMPYIDSMEMAYIFRSKMFQESFIIGQVWIGLSGREVPEWCSYKNTGDVLSFVVPKHSNNKICGVIVCAITNCDDQVRLAPTMLNKTKETNDCFSILSFDRCSMYVMFYPVNDARLVVEAGDTLEFQFHVKGNANDSSCGLCLIYEGDVLDDYTLLIQKLI